MEQFRIFKPSPVVSSAKFGHIARLRKASLQSTISGPFQSLPRTSERRCERPRRVRRGRSCFRTCTPSTWICRGPPVRRVVVGRGTRRRRAVEQQTHGGSGHGAVLALKGGEPKTRRQSPTARNRLVVSWNNPVNYCWKCSTHCNTL